MFKQSAQHVASYYAQTYPANIPLRPTLQGTQDTDVLIIAPVSAACTLPCA